MTYTVLQNPNLVSEAKGKEALANAKGAYSNLANNRETAHKVAGADDYKSKKNMFISLIAETMKNPDPNSEMKPEETVMQMMQMHQIESSAHMNEKMGEMADQIKNLVKMGQASIQGQDVKIKSSTMLIQDGEAKFEYETPKDLKSLEIIIREQGKNGVAGKTVDRIDLTHPDQGKNTDLEAGTHALTWEAKDIYGEPFDPSKRYVASFVAKDMDGEYVKTSHKMLGRIEGVDFTRTKDVDVTIGNNHYPINQLQIFQRDQEARSNRAQDDDEPNLNQRQDLQDGVTALSRKLSSLNGSTTSVGNNPIHSFF